MKKTSLLVTLTLLVIALITVSCGPPPTPAPTPTPTIHPGKALVSSKCATCHPFTVVESAKKNAATWQATVENMVTRGALLDTEQVKLVVDYLTLTYVSE